MTEADTIKVRAICEDAPVITEGKDFKIRDAYKCSNTLTRILDVLTEAEQEVPMEKRNGDGDTLEDIKAVWEDFHGRGSIEELIDGRWRRMCFTDVFDRSVRFYHITAKHVSRFDSECMFFEPWARATIGRGMDCHRAMANGCAFRYNRITTSGTDLITWDNSHNYLIAAHDPSDEWTAIPRAAAPAGEPPPAKDAPDAGLPIDCEGGAPLTESYLQPLWELMHQEHGLILVESEMHDIMAVCKQIEAKLREDAPSGDSDAAETVIIPRGLLKAICLTGSAIAREANGDWGKKQSLIRLLKRCDTKVITHRQYKAPPPQQGAKGGGNEN